MIKSKVIEVLNNFNGVLLSLEKTNNLISDACKAISELSNHIVRKKLDKPNKRAIVRIIGYKTSPSPYFWHEIIDYPFEPHLISFSPDVSMEGYIQAHNCYIIGVRVAGKTVTDGAVFPGESVELPAMEPCHTAEITIVPQFIL